MLCPSGVRQALAHERTPVGTYLLAQDDGHLVLLTIAPGGNAFSQQTGQFEPPAVFGDQQGGWTMPRAGKILIRTIDFTRDTATGSFTGFGRCLYTASLNPDGTLTGKFLVEIFPPDADPLDLSPSNIPTETFGPVNFTGRRLKVR